VLGSFGSVMMKFLESSLFLFPLGRPRLMNALQVFCCCMNRNATMNAANEQRSILQWLLPELFHMILRGLPIRDTARLSQTTRGLVSS